MRSKKWFIPVLVAMFAVLTAFTSFAEEGWVQNGNIWNYFDKDGNKVYYAWKKGNDGKWRWLDGQGAMAVNSWVDDQYYVDADGVMVTQNWLKVTDRNDTFWFYFDENGKLVTGRWKKIGEKWHYFDEEGHLLMGWILDNMYYTGTDGAMKTGWQYLPDYEDDEYAADTLNTSHWYYFLTSGKLFKPSTDAEFTTKRIDETLYCFNSRGALQTGWVNFENGTDGVPITGYKYFNSDGSLRTGWYAAQPPEDLESSYDDRVVWFYFSNSGVPRAETSGRYTLADICKIGMHSYMFDRNGVPVYGFRKVYLSETSSEFETYYFGEKNDQYMMTGKRTIRDSDGEIADYYFSNNGRGFNGVYGGCVYYRGRKQVPDSGEKYAVISFPNGGTYLQYLVNASGTVMKNKTKLKDSDGNIYVTNGQGIVQSINGKSVSSSTRYGSVVEPYYDD